MAKWAFIQSSINQLFLSLSRIVQYWPLVSQCVPSRTNKELFFLINVSNPSSVFHHWTLNAGFLLFFFLQTNQVVFTIVMSPALWPSISDTTNTPRGEGSKVSGLPRLANYWPHSPPLRDLKKATYKRLAGVPHLSNQPWNGARRGG